jgi:hypothetical protein
VNSRKEALTHGRAYGQVSKLLNVVIFGEWETAPGLIFGKMLGSQVAPPGKL